MMNFIKTLRLTDTGLSLVHTPQSVCSFVVLAMHAVAVVGDYLSLIHI